jgi:hypothetical protein
MSSSWARQSWARVILFLERLREENIAAPVMLRDEELLRFVEAACPAPVAEQLAFSDIHIDKRSGGPTRRQDRFPACTAVRVAVVLCLAPGCDIVAS